MPNFSVFSCKTLWMNNLRHFDKLPVIYHLIIVSQKTGNMRIFLINQRSVTGSLIYLTQTDPNFEMIVGIGVGAYYLDIDYLQDF